MDDLITVGREQLAVIPHKRAALAACVRVSGLPPKSIAYLLEIDRSHLTKMLTDTPDPRHFPQEKELLLMDVCRNEVPLDWLLLQRGLPVTHEIRVLLAELETLRTDVARLRMEAKAVTNVFKFIGE